MNADYGIFEVHWDDDHSRIIQYHIWPFDRTNNTLSALTLSYSVEQIANMINSMYQPKLFYTLPKKKGNYVWGAKVVVGSYNSVLYLTTDPNNIKEDNLESLPEY